MKAIRYSCTTFTKLKDNVTLIGTDNVNHFEQQYWVSYVKNSNFGRLFL